MGVGSSSGKVKEVGLKDFNTGQTGQIDLINGVKRLRVQAEVVVTSSFGVDGFADTWFSLGDPDDCDGIGAAGDEIEISIPAGCIPSEYPAILYTYVITAANVAAAQPEISVRDAIITSLNLDITFNFQWKAVRVRDNGIIVIQSRFRGEVGERTTWGITTTGTTVVQLGYADIQQRSKSVSISRDTDDPRVGLFGISGNVSTTPGSIGKRFSRFLLNGASNDMRVDGSITPQVFDMVIDPIDELFCTQIRIFGGGNGIKLANFLSKNTAFVNGLTIEIKSDNEVLSFAPMKNTQDLKNLFSFPSGDYFRLDIEAAGDQCLAIFNPIVPFIIRPENVFGVGNNDYIKLVVNDDASSGLGQLQALAIGFRRTP